MKEEEMEIGFPENILVALAGKTLRVFLKEEYLICDCSVCKKLRKLHKKSEPYVKWGDYLAKLDKDAVKTT